jgi:hypothetical protein
MVGYSQRDGEYCPYCTLPEQKRGGAKLTFTVPAWPFRDAGG